MNKQKLISERILASRIIKASWINLFFYVLSFGKLGKLFEIKHEEKIKYFPSIPINCRCSTIPFKITDKKINE